MKTFGRRTISVILSVIMVLSCFAGMTFSVGAETSGDYDYEVLDDGTVSITKYNGSDSDVIIPSEIDGKKVTVVGPDAFNSCTGLTSVTMQDGITCVGERAFQRCSNLVSVEMQDSDSVITIGMIAFEGCAFKELTIPEGVESLRYYAVGNCENLESITLPKSLKSLGERALCGDISLREINIPEKLENIGLGAFECCTSLESYNVSENNETFTSVDGVIFSKDMKTLILYPEGRKDTEYTIPDGVEKIKSVGDYPGALNSQSLEKVIIPESVTEIPENTIGYYNFIKKEGFVIVGKLDSAAEKYANENEFEFVNIESQNGINSDSDKTTSPSAENPSEATTVPTTNVGVKLEFADNANVDGKIDEENKKVSIVPSLSAGITLDEFKEMFKGAVSVAGEKIDKVFNGMKFIFNGSEYTFIIKGDTEADGKISAADARAILRIAAKLESPDDVTKESADIDSDGKVTSKEARSVLRFAARLQSKIYE